MRAMNPLGRLLKRFSLRKRQGGYLGIATRRVMGTLNARRRLDLLLDGAPFYAPLTAGLALTHGTGSQTITCDPQTVQNNDGFLVTCLAGEIPIKGGRRIYNLIPAAGTGSASLAVAANKSMTLAAGTYVFSMGAGTGTATFSGTGGATGTLDASASGRVSVSKTITAGTLVVTASVATLVDLQVESVDAQTTKTAGEYVSVGVLSSPWHGAGVDGVKWFSTDINGNPIAPATLDGVEVWPAGTQILATADIRDMTTANWVLGATMTRARTSVGYDGAANSATRLTGGAVAATNTCYLTVTAAASSRTYSAMVKRVTGTGPVRIVQTGTETDISAQLSTTGYALVELNASVLNVAIGFKIDTNGDAIDVDFNQFESGSYATSRMAATGSARNASVISVPTASNIASGAGYIALEYTPGHAPSGQVALWGTYVDASNYTRLMLQKVTNLLTAPGDLTNGAWLKVNGGTGTLPVVTSGQTDPNGGATAFRVQCNAGAGTGVGDYSIVRQNIAAGTTLKAVWVKSNTASSQTFSFTTGTVSGNVTATTSWQRLFATNTVAVFDIGTAGFGGTTASLDLLVWQPQGEQVGSVASQFAAPYTATSATFAIWRKVIAAVAYDAYIANEYVSGTTYKMAASWGSGGTNIALGGTLGTPHANTTAAQIGTTMQTGADGNSASQPGMAIKNVYIGQRELSAAELIMVTLP